jgi:hypothetical protein
MFIYIDKNGMKVSSKDVYTKMLSVDFDLANIFQTNKSPQRKNESQQNRTPDKLSGVCSSAFFLLIYVIL